MDDFNLWELFNERPEVFEAHELRDSEREPYIEEYDPAHVGLRPGELPVGVSLFTNDYWY